MVLNYEIHWKVLIHVYLQLKSGYNENDLALTLLSIPLRPTYEKVIGSPTFNAGIFICMQQL